MIPRVSGFAEAVRAELYRYFIATGRAPSAAEIAGTLRCGTVEVERAYIALTDARAITLDAAGKDLWMVHPFSAVETPYRVDSGGVSYWANCAWDALAIAAVLRQDTSATAACPDCGGAVDLSVVHGRVTDAPAVVHFAVPPLQFWENIDFT